MAGRRTNTAETRRHNRAARNCRHEWRGSLARSDLHDLDVRRRPGVPGDRRGRHGRDGRGDHVRARETARRVQYADTDLYRYSPATNSWTAMAPMPASGRRGAVGFAVGGKGYLGTGSYSNDFWEYNPGTNSWTSIAPFPGTARISSVAFNIGSKGYMGTGDDGGPNGDFYEYNPVTNIWTPLASMPGLPRMEGGGFSINGKGYIGCGCDFQSGTNYQDFWEYDPIANYWNQITDYSGAARRYLSCFAIGTRGYGVFGTSGTNYNDLWEYGNYVGLADVPEMENTNCIKTFPNPFTDEFTFSISREIKFDSNAFIKIMDVTGKTVMIIENINQYEVKVERGTLKNGIYFYEFQNNSQRTIGKFIAL